MPLLQINGKQIQNNFKAQMKSIYAELLFLTTACICPAHIPSDFWLRNLSFLIFFFYFSFPADCIGALSWWYPPFFK